MVCCSTASRAPWDLQPGVEREIVNRVQSDVRAAVLEAQKTSTADNRGAVAKKSSHQAISGIGEVRDQCIGYQHARLGLKPADHSEECRARIVRHMTADDDLRNNAL